MKYLKMLALAAVAAGAVMAFIGAGTASATVLCETGQPGAGEDCGTKVAAGTIFHYTQDTGTSFKLATTGGTTIATCTEGTVRGEVTNAGSTTETVKIQLDETNDATHLTGNKTGLSFGSCTTTVRVLKAGTEELHRIAGTNNATVTSTGNETTINFLGVSCVFTTNSSDVGTLTGSTTSASTFDFSGTIPSSTGGLCPEKGVLSGNFIQTAPANTFGVAADG